MWRNGNGGMTTKCASAKRSKKIPPRELHGAGFFVVQLLSDDVDGAELAGILGIGLGVIGHLLALGQGTEALGLDGGEVDEHVAAAVIVGDEAEALFVVEPFDSAVIHSGSTSQKMLSPCKNKSHQSRMSKWKLTWHRRQSIFTF